MVCYVHMNFFYYSLYFVYKLYLKLYYLNIYMFNFMQHHPVIWIIKDLGKKKVIWIQVIDHRLDNLQVPYPVTTVSFNCRQISFFIHA